MYCTIYTHSFYQYDFSMHMFVKWHTIHMVTSGAADRGLRSSTWKKTSTFTIKSMQAPSSEDQEYVLGLLWSTYFSTGWSEMHCGIPEVFMSHMTSILDRMGGANTLGPYFCECTRQLASWSVNWSVRTERTDKCTYRKTAFEILLNPNDICANEEEP